MSALVWMRPLAGWRDKAEAQAGGTETVTQKSALPWACGVRRRRHQDPSKDPCAKVRGLLGLPKVSFKLWY